MFSRRDPLHKRRPYKLWARIDMRVGPPIPACEVTAERLQRFAELALLEMDARQAVGSVVPDDVVHGRFENRPDRPACAVMHAVVELEVADRELRLTDVMVERVELGLVFERNDDAANRTEAIERPRLRHEREEKKHHIDIPRRHGKVDSLTGWRRRIGNEPEVIGEGR